MKTIRKIQKFKPCLHLKRVAAYVRVSVDTDKTERSFSNQVSYFSELIQSNPEWVYAGVYSDLGITGTNTKKRQGFQKMLDDAEAGKIDVILTKSIQRFARNTVDLLSIVRHLKELGVEVRFEKERINSLSGDGELMLTILASFAQAESQNISTNIRWTFKKKNTQGIPNQHFFVYGYRWEGDRLVPFPAEAEVVRKIYADFLAGKTLQEIVDSLLASGVKTFRGRKVFWRTSINNMLRNSVYTGEMLLQKGFVIDPLSKKYKRNEGELPQYLVPDDHEAIIDRKTFDDVQALIAEKKEKGMWANKSLNLTCFSGKIKDPYTKKSYHRHPRTSGAVYWESKGKVRGSIREKTLKKITTEVLGLTEFDETAFSKAIDHIEIPKSHTLQFFFKDGRKATRRWEDIVFKQEWTDEMKRQVVERLQSNPKYPFSRMLKCKHCGNFLIHSFTCRTKKSGWRCRNCHGYTVEKFSDERLEKFVTAALNLTSFDEEVFRRKVEYLSVSPDGSIFIHYRKEQENCSVE